MNRITQFRDSRRRATDACEGVARYVWNCAGPIRGIAKPVRETIQITSRAAAAIPKALKERPAIYDDRRNAGQRLTAEGIDLGLVSVCQF